QTAGNQKINSCISYNFGTVQHKKINQLPVKHYTDDPVKDSQKSTHSQCPSGILCGSLWSVCTQALTDIHLSPNTGNCGKSIGKPHKHSRCTYCSHCTASQTPDPYHIHKVISHLYQRS